MMSLVPRALVLVCIALATAIALLFVLVAPHWTAPAPQRPDVATFSTESMRIGGEPLSMAEVNQRPLFSPARRPAVSEVVQVEQPPAPDPFGGAQLLGIFGSGGNAGVILKSGADVHRIARGESWNGWQLKSVGEREAWFSSQGNPDKALPLLRLAQQGGLVADLRPPAGVQPRAAEARPAQGQAVEGQAAEGQAVDGKAAEGEAPQWQSADEPASQPAAQPQSLPVGRARASPSARGARNSPSGERRAASNGAVSK